MATTPCSITVVPPTLPGTSTPQSVSVTISSDRAGASPVTAYTSENGSSAATWPATVATTTTYWLTTEGNYYVSALTPSGQQVARDDYTVEQVACRGAQELRKTVACRVPTDAPTASGTALLADTTFMAGVATSVVNSSTASSQYAPKLSGAASVGGSYYGSPAYTVTTAALVSGTLTATPWRVEYATIVDRLRAEVTGAGAGGSVVRLGIYASAANSGRPGALVVDGGTIDGTSTTAQEVTVNVTLTPGLYWLVGVAQGGTPTARILQGTTDPVTPADSTMSGVRSGWSQTGVADALPATFSTTPTVITNAVRVFARTNP